MKSAKENHDQSRPSLVLRIKLLTARTLALALIVTSIPPPAKAAYVDKSGSLPGTISGRTVAIVGGAAGAAAGLLIYYAVKKKRHSRRVKPDRPPAKFSGIVPGQPMKETVPITNHLYEPATSKP